MNSFEWFPRYECPIHNNNNILCNLDLKINIQWKDKEIKLQKVPTCIITEKHNTFTLTNLFFKFFIKFIQPWNAKEISNIHSLIPIRQMQKISDRTQNLCNKNFPLFWCNCQINLKISILAEIGFVFYWLNT